MEHTPLLIGIRQVLELVPVTRSHLYKAVREGNFPRPIKMGKRSLWKIKEIEAWVKKQISFP